MLKSVTPPLLLFNLLIVLASTSCVEYKLGQCIRCSSSQVLFNNNCITSIEGCVRYLSEKVCAQCNPVMFQLNGTTCTPIESTTGYNENIADANITLYQLAAFGDYVQISFSQMHNDRGFAQCDKFLRNGEYQHFISRTAQPVQFAAVRNTRNWRNYEIIYQASGGGLLMYMASYDTTSSAVTIESIVSIGTSQIVDHCLSYSPSLQCNYCEQNYHLDSGICNRNIEGCLSYYKSICLSCQGFLLLIENRCVGSCGQLCDTNKIHFSQGHFS